MSGIAGCCLFEGGVVSRATVDALLAGIAQCGPDGRTTIHSGPAVLLQRAFFTGRAPEPAQWYDRDGLSIVWDGRLDNRAELIARTGAAPHSSDVEVIAALYRKDPERDFLAPAVGDFAFALRDARTATLIL